MSFTGATSKYFGRSDAIPGQELMWPGGPDGLPYRGPRAPNLRTEEYEDLPTEFDFHCGTFRTWNKDDMDLYASIQDRVLNGVYTELRRSDMVYDASNGGWMFFMEWCAGFHGPMPSGMRAV